MTEYWKSQARKYCEFCKCWFADNKVSISFHENGKRHKENVQKHISKLSKKSAKDFKHKEKIEDDIKKMEEAAMAAYLKDVQNNADLTSQSINDMLAESGNSSSTLCVDSSNTAKKDSSSDWQEVKDDDGNSYFWNIQTNETTWDPPDNYVSIAQQEEKKLKAAKDSKAKETIKKQKHKESVKAMEDEVKARAAREKMKELAPSKQKPPSHAVDNIQFGPATKAEKPYGAWTPVVKAPVEKIDLQLPKLDKVVPPPPVIMEPEVFKFKEKRIESLGEGPVEFKKRKFNNTKRNMRQKLDDD